jgi:hypothetical protein
MFGPSNILGNILWLVGAFLVGILACFLFLRQASPLAIGPLLPVLPGLPVKVDHLPLRSAAIAIHPWR